MDYTSVYIQSVVQMVCRILLLLKPTWHLLAGLTIACLHGLHPRPHLSCIVTHHSLLYHSIIHHSRHCSSHLHLWHPHTYTTHTWALSHTGLHTRGLLHSSCHPRIPEPRHLLLWHSTHLPWRCSRHSWHNTGLLHHTLLRLHHNLWLLHHTRHSWLAHSHISHHTRLLHTHSSHHSGLRLNKTSHLHATHSCLWCIKKVHNISDGLLWCGLFHWLCKVGKISECVGGSSSRGCSRCCLGGWSSISSSGLGRWSLKGIKLCPATRRSSSCCRGSSSRS
mmetsp:Transcript_36292/g.43842  ORF Transcript_36292/g.43842 Transcript_36292/m.43842 type:complete len:278 (-) Transcript_36292:802-1635(-)